MRPPELVIVVAEPPDPLLHLSFGVHDSKAGPVRSALWLLAAVKHRDPPIRHRGKAKGATDGFRPARKIGTVSVENLHAVVFAVGNVDAVSRINGDGVRKIKMARSLSSTSPVILKLPSLANSTMRELP